VEGEGLHDQRALGPFRIGVEPFDFGKQARGLVRLAAVLQLELATAIDFLGGQAVERNLFLTGAAGHQHRGQGEARYQSRRPSTRHGTSAPILSPVVGGRFACRLLRQLVRLSRSS
jgi:hypothetical protein